MKDSKKWNTAPHGLILETHREWYTGQCGYYYDYKRESDSYDGWVVKSTSADPMNCHPGLTSKSAIIRVAMVKTDGAYEFDEAYNSVKRKLRQEYPDLKFSNDDIFNRMQGKTIRLGDKDEYKQR